MQALRDDYESLTPREREVMALVVAGLLNKQVGGELGISEITVKAHRGQVMRKMNADSLPDLVVMAARLGLPSPGTGLTTLWVTRRAARLRSGIGGPVPALSSEPPATPDKTPASDPASAAAPPSRRTALLRSGLIVGVLIVVFGIILPRYIDYADVAAAFRDLTIQQFLVVTAFGIVAWVASGLIFSSLIEGLSWVRGTMSWLILGGIGASVPFGPWNMGVLWVVVRGWGIGTGAATAGVALYGVINELSRLALPLIGIVALALSGELTAGGQNAETARTIAILSAIAFVVVTGLIIGIVRSERVADWLGRRGQAAADWILRRLGRDGSPDVAGAIHRFRDQLGFVIRRRGLRSLAIAVVAQFAWMVVLLVSLRLVGVPENALSTARDLRRLRPGDGHHHHPALARRCGRLRAALHLGVLDPGTVLRGGDHGGRVPVPDLLLVRARADRLDPAQGGPSGPVDAPDDRRAQGLCERQRGVTGVGMGGWATVS